MTTRNERSKHCRVFGMDRRPIWARVWIFFGVPMLAQRPTIDRFRIALRPAMLCLKSKSIDLWPCPSQHRFAACLKFPVHHQRAPSNKFGRRLGYSSSLFNPLAVSHAIRSRHSIDSIESMQPQTN